MPDDKPMCIAQPAGRPDHIDIADTVAYTPAFLSRRRQYPNAMSSALGIVMALHYLRDGTVLAEIQWNKPDLPKQAYVKNLIRVQSAAIRRIT